MDIIKLDKDSITSYLGFTFPKYQNEICENFSSLNYIAIGANHGFLPIGLILAKVENKRAHLLSIFVDPDYRNQGIGNALYKKLERELKSCDIQEIYLEYMKEKKTTPYLEKILKNNKFQEPRLNMTFLYFNHADIIKPPWVSKFTLPTKYEIFKLQEMTSKDKDHYNSIISQKSFPKELKIAEDFQLCKETSFGLRVHGEFIGWMTTHFINDDLLRYSCLYVIKEYLPKGASIGLITHTIREHYKVFKDTKPRALFGVRFDYDRMQKMVFRKFAPYASSIQKGMAVSKFF